MGGLGHLLEREPADLNVQTPRNKTDQERYLQIKYTGGAEMDGWAHTFTEEQFHGLIHYIRLLSPSYSQKRKTGWNLADNPTNFRGLGKVRHSLSFSTHLCSASITRLGYELKAI